MLSAIFFLFVGFIGMEVFSWTFHKYVMHGILWNIHKTHHTHTKGFFELNDIFSLTFGSIATILMFLGMDALDFRFWIGAGITVYGFIYFILHDVFIHRRIQWKLPFGGNYIDGIKHAHQMHHKSNQRDDSEAFGLLWVSRKYFKEAKARKRSN